MRKAALPLLTVLVVWAIALTGCKGDKPAPQHGDVNTPRAEKPAELNAGPVSEYMSFPVPMQIDLRFTVESSLYFKCKSKTYDLSFPEFSNRKLDSREAAFQQLVFAIGEKNLPKCWDLSFRSPSMAPEEVSRRKNIITNTVGVLSKYFDPAILGEDFEKLRIGNQFFLGNEGLFTWGIDRASSPSLPPFRVVCMFETNFENRFVWNLFHGRLDPLITLLGNAMDQNAKSPGKYQPIINAAFDYDIPIFGSAGPNPVYLQFNGRTYNNIDIFKDAIDPDDEVLAFYQKAYRTLKDRSPQDFTQFYTQRSREKYLAWLEKGDPNSLERMILPGFETSV